ncbi:MAG TPA: short-chain dehydrogenase, partial [Micromonosporaceae bacterium]|nr:short-chain dehydrogenase [Micromonosporaceae bacterium]
MRPLAVISGGGTGIGAAIAQGLSADGFDLVLVGRRAAPLAETASKLDGANTVVADLRDPGSAGVLLEAVGDREVGAIVNNAGGYLGRSGDDLPEIARQWRDTFDTNVMTAVVLTETLLPRLRRPDGRVILFSSIAAQRGGGGPYSAAKAALHGWALDLAVQLGPQGVTVNVISPGYVAETEFFAGRMTPHAHQSRVDQTLIGRAGSPEDIAQT